MKHKLTSIFGSIAGAAIFLHQAGISIGHLGSIDFITLIGAVATIALGAFASDATLTNQNATAVKNLIDNNNGALLRKLNPDGTPATNGQATANKEN